MRVPPDQGEPRPLISTRTLLIVVVAVGAAVLTAAAPRFAVPIGVGVAVITLLAQIVKD